MIEFVRAMLLLTASLAWGTAVQAALVTYHYTGRVGDISDIVAANGPIRAGDVVTGSFTLDTGVPDEVSIPEWGRYSGFVSGTTTIGALTFTSTGGRYEVYDRVDSHPGGDRFFLTPSGVEVAGPDLTGWLESFRDFTIRFQPAGSNILASDAPPDLVDFFAASGSDRVLGALYFGSGGSRSEIFFQLNSLSLREPGNAVPEPGSLALVALGLVGLTARRRGAARPRPGAQHPD